MAQCRFKRIGFGCVTAIPVDDRERNSPSRTKRDVVGCDRRRYRLRLGRISEPEGTVHLRLGYTGAFVI
jgi:hypothetical protein